MYCFRCTLNSEGTPYQTSGQHITLTEYDAKENSPILLCQNSYTVETSYPVQNQPGKVSSADSVKLSSSDPFKLSPVSTTLSSPPSSQPFSSPVYHSPTPILQSPLSYSPQLNNSASGYSSVTNLEHCGQRVNLQKKLDEVSVPGSVYMNPAQYPLMMALAKTTDLKHRRQETGGFTESSGRPTRKRSLKVSN